MMEMEDFLRQSDEAFQKGADAFAAKQYRDSLPFFKESLDLNPDKWEARLYVGMVHYKLNELHSAVNAFKWIIDKCPDEDIRSRAATALAPIEEEMATGLPAGAISAVLTKPSEKELRDVHKASTQQSKPGGEVTQTLTKPGFAGAARGPFIPDKIGIPLIAIVILGFAYYGMSFMLPDMYSQMFVKPNKQSVASLKISLPSGVERQDITFTGAGGVKMCALYVHNPVAKSVVMINHGSAGTIDGDAKLIEELAKADYSVFDYDYRGFGQSEGEATLRGLLDDALLAHDYIQGKLSHPANDIILVGEGVASGVACEIAHRRGAEAVVLMGGYRNLMDIAKQNNPLFGIYPKDWLPQQQYDNTAWAKEHDHAYLLTGYNSPVIPPAVTDKFYAMVADPKTTGEASKIVELLSAK